MPRDVYQKAFRKNSDGLFFPLGGTEMTKEIVILSLGFLCCSASLFSVCT